MQGDIQDHSKNLDYINKTGSELQNKAAPGDKTNKLKCELQDMNSRWTVMSEQVDERVYKLEAAIEQLTQLEVTDYSKTKLCMWITIKYNYLKTEESYSKYHKSEVEM